MNITRLLALRNEPCVKAKYIGVLTRVMLNSQGNADFCP